MDSDKLILLQTRKANFEKFYEEMIPVIVEFVGRLGIQPAHQVLNHAEEFVPYVARTLQDLEVSEEDRIWLLTRVGYFIGECIVQKYSGCWFVNDDSSSSSFAHYVVGKFQRVRSEQTIVDPFHFAKMYVNEPAPRHFDKIFAEVDRLVNLTSES